MPDDEEATDVLGAPYTARTLQLRPDDEGDVVATLVTRRAQQQNNRKAVLHVHGFADYFFQTVAADWWVARGYDFYALDLRKYGRSLRAHQTPNYAADMTAYYEELDAAYAIIAADHDHLVLSGHSTGGLIVPLWLNDHKPSVAGLALNSPWLDMAASFFIRTVGTKAIDRIGALQPMRLIPRDVSGLYARSLHREHDGEWDFNLEWKPLASFAVYAGWLRAVRRAHARIHRGIDVGAPVLVLCSTRSGHPVELDDVVGSTDIVLDVEQIRRWSPYLGQHVTIASVDGAMHDVTLSPRPARDRVFEELGRWLGAYVDR